MVYPFFYRSQFTGFVTKYFAIQSKIISKLITKRDHKIYMSIYNS